MILSTKPEVTVGKVPRQAVTFDEITEGCALLGQIGIIVEYVIPSEVEESPCSTTSKEIVTLHGDPSAPTVARNDIIGINETNTTIYTHSSNN